MCDMNRGLTFVIGGTGVESPHPHAPAGPLAAPHLKQHEDEDTVRGKEVRNHVMPWKDQRQQSIFSDAY